MHHVKYKGCAKGLDKAHPQAIDLRRRGLNAEDGADGGRYVALSGAQKVAK